MNIQNGPVLLTADAADVCPGSDGHHLVVSGPRWDTVGDVTWVWRRFVFDTDVQVDVPCQEWGDDRRWSVAVRVKDLVPREPAGRSVDALANLADWTLFAVPRAGMAYPVATDAYLVGRLPIELDLRKYSVGLQPRAGALHVEVR